MKQLITILFILFSSTGIYAQDNSDFNTIMKSTLTKMSKAKTADDYQNLANTFARIADKEEGKWEPVYYNAFIKTFQAFEAKDKEKAGAELELLTDKLKSTLEFESVVSDSMVQSEIHALIAMMYSARMSANPMVLGPTLAPLNEEHLGKAVNLNITNPRVYLLYAQNLFYTPEAFGGNKKKAKDLAVKALTLFEQDKDDSLFMPSWGKNQVEGLIENMKNGNEEEEEG